MLRRRVARVVRVWIGVGLGCLAVCLAGKATADTRSDILCLQWASVAAAEAGVPERLMHAITRVETGRGAAPAWPWAINADGEGHWLASSRQAKGVAAQALSEGVEQIDVGCFQLNIKWHGEAFASLDEMLDPSRNARYAARFLRHLHAEFGNWTDAAAAFHSRTPALGRAYLKRLQATLAEMPDPWVEVPEGLFAAQGGPKPLLSDVRPPTGGGAAPERRSLLTSVKPAAAGATDGRGGLLFVRR